MVITLDNGQTITIYEDGNLLKQIEPYIDKEIFDLLEEKFGFIQTTYKNFNLVQYGDELIGQTIKCCNVGNGCDLENSIIATEEGNALILNADCDEDNYINVKALTKEQLDKRIVKDSYFRKELLNNNIINENYAQKLLDIEKWKSKEEDRKIKEKRYAEYIKMKKEFEV
jgi:hypothetical protein